MNIADWTKPFDFYPYKCTCIISFTHIQFLRVHTFLNFIILRWEGHIHVTFEPACIWFQPFHISCTRWFSGCWLAYFPCCFPLMLLNHKELMISYIIPILYSFSSIRTTRQKKKKMMYLPLITLAKSWKL